MPPPEDIALLTGLGGAEAAQRLARDGPNELPSARPRRLFAIALDVLREPMFLMLLACAGIYLLLGDRREALTLLGFVFIVIGIPLVQERKSERALEALRDLSSPRALVLRDGKQQRIAGREVVRGDIVLLAEGDRVPADAVLLSVSNLAVDESLLTGESLTVSKLVNPAAAQAMEMPGGHEPHCVYSGTLVVQGKGVARVLATGAATAIGRIGHALGSIVVQPTALQRETRRVVKLVAIGSSSLAVLLAVWYGATRADWLNGLLAGITFAMALLPEELPVVLALFLGIGAWRLSRQQVLTRRIPVVEMLGAATVLCVDKTGTLTENRMRLGMLSSAGGACFDLRAHPADNAEALPEEFHAVLEFAMLASHRDPFDPMEKSIQQQGRHILAGTEHIHDSWHLVEEYPLSPELLAMSRVWRSPDLENYVIAAKGAPEAVADLCHLDEASVRGLMERVDALAAQGLRVLGVARADFRRQALPPIQHDFAFRFLGLVGLADPVREGVPAALAECRQAGIRVVMITGDYPATARRIAAECGLDSPGGVLTGAELDALDDAQLRSRSAGINIFCRVAPEQKLRLVQVLRADGEVVAMTGDGVNDAPALKAAQIGIAMGGRGTDVAREAADLVLLNDDFSAIVTAVRLGRRIFDNFRKVGVFIIAVHLPLLGLSFVPVLAGWPILLMPVHVVFLQLIIDPVCSIVFEAEAGEHDLMRRPPRPPGAKVFDRQVIVQGMLQGLALLATVLLLYLGGRGAGLAPDQLRALCFSALMIGSLGLVVLNRSWSLTLAQSLRQPNPALWWITAASLGILALALFLPSVARSALFRAAAMAGAGYRRGQRAGADRSAAAGTSGASAYQ